MIQTETSRHLMLLCRELSLVGGGQLGIDGSFFNVSDSDARVKTKAQLEAEISAIERYIVGYQEAPDGEDADEADAMPASTTPAHLQRLDADGETQHWCTDPDARRLRKNGCKVTGYNVQSVVDGERTLILGHEATNAGSDLGQVRGEMVQLVQRYNLRRVLAMLGVDAFILICRQWRQAREAGAQGAGFFAPYCGSRRRLLPSSAPCVRRAICDLPRASFSSSAPEALVSAV